MNESSSNDFLASKKMHGNGGTHLLPRMTFDLRKFKFGIVWIHFADLFASRRAQHLDDLDELVDARVAREYRLAQQQFGQYTASAPDICQNANKSIKYFQKKSVESAIFGRPALPIRVV